MQGLVGCVELRGKKLDCQRWSSAIDRRRAPPPSSDTEYTALRQAFFDGERFRAMPSGIRVALTANRGAVVCALW